MALYSILSDSFKGFELNNETNHLGKLTYKSWFSYHSEIKTLNNDVFKLVTKSFLSSNLNLLKNNEVIIEGGLNWKGQFIFNTNNFENLTFKLKSLTSNNYVLQNENGEELLNIAPIFQFKTLNYNYEITSNNDFEFMAHKEAFILMIMHCINYYFQVLICTTLLIAVAIL